ncbi:MAG: hypothetical protein IH969_04075 [Candidatus Krumholzibacteriota bacterium]|nr:hypothetical protein [Candidatus Krumholzibacteriota bacterium]
MIAHFRDGSLVKGTTSDFFPTRKKFNITDAGGKEHRVQIGALKAIFFVRELEGDPEHAERKGFFHRQSRGKKVMVKFSDGEVIFGHTLSYSRRGQGFFMFPGDPDCNNTKVFVVHAATELVKVMDLPTALSPNHYSH